MEIAVLVVNLLLNLWLFIILARQNVRKRLPWFVLYVASEVLSGLVQLISSWAGNSSYRVVYWSMEGIEIALMAAAVQESFFQIFHKFTKKATIRWLFWSVIAAVVLRSAWKALHSPPVQTSRDVVFIIAAEKLYRWGILAIALLTGVLSAVIHERVPVRTRQEAVMAGFGVNAAGVLLYVSFFAELGLRYTFFTKYFATMAYFIASGWWIWIFTRPDDRFGFAELGMGPDDIAKKLGLYGEHADEITRTKW
jgi:hypothetical protein